MSAARQRQMKLLRPLVFKRAGGRCEAGEGGRRCPCVATVLQHALPRARARAGDEHLLDREAVRALDAGTFDADRHLAHLLALCTRCDRLATANDPWAKALRLVLPGEVRTGPDGRPVYRGADGLLSDLWGEREAA